MKVIFGEFVKDVIWIGILMGGAYALIYEALGPNYWI